MALSKLLVPSLMAIALFLIPASSQEDSTSFSFTGFNPMFSPNPNLSNLTYEGDASVESTGNGVRLTGGRAIFERNSTGRVLYSPPVTFWVPGRQASFETTVTFSVGINGGLIGDGLTFFIIPVNSPIPVDSYGGNFGIFNPLTGRALSVFAVEFDYYFTGADAAWDPKYHHIGIDINSRVSKNTTQWNVPFSPETVTAVINYDSSTRTITVVSTQPSESNLLSYVFDLKTILPEQVHVGISGTTGVWFSSPRLHSWSFSSILMLDSTDVVEASAEKIEEHIKQYV